MTAKKTGHTVHTEMGRPLPLLNRLYCHVDLLMCANYSFVRMCNFSTLMLLSVIHGLF